MFERYTEKARRVIFFARYESSQYGTPQIETEHLLLGLLREDKYLVNKTLSLDAVTAIRKKIDDRSPKRPGIPTSVDLPLAEESKKVLTGAATEADGLGHKHIGTEHLLIAILKNEETFAAQLLREEGLDLAELRRKIAIYVPEPAVSGRGYTRSHLARETIEIHGITWSADYIRERVRRYKSHSWHWQLRPWSSPDIVIHRATGKVSFDLALAQDTANFELVKGGWKHLYCDICNWELSIPEDVAHNSRYTNGRDWMCAECYEKFFKGPDFFASTYSEIT